QAPSELASAPDAEIESPEELGAVAASARRAADDDQNRDVFARPCAGSEFDGIDEYVATATYRGRPVLIGIDTGRQYAFAVDPGTCEVVAEAPLP
ncbi:MAG: hypothetical protein ACRDZZ_03030, partial [Ilumatobacteraceae bacterium]